MSKKIVLRETLRGFARNMEFVLRQHDRSKRHWSNLQYPEELFDKLVRKTYQLHKALENGTKKTITRKCCDIANFAMMIYDNEGEALDE